MVRKKKKTERKVTGLHLTGKRSINQVVSADHLLVFPLDGMSQWRMNDSPSSFMLSLVHLEAPESTSKQFDKKWYLPNFHFCFSARGYIWTEYRAFASSTYISKVAKVFGNERTMWVSIHYILINWSFLLGWMLVSAKWFFCIFFPWNGFCKCN